MILLIFLLDFYAVLVDGSDGHDSHLAELRRSRDEKSKKKDFGGTAVIMVFFGIFILSMILIHFYLKRRERRITDYNIQLRNSKHEKEMI